VYSSLTTRIFLYNIIFSAKAIIGSHFSLYIVGSRLLTRRIASLAPSGFTLLYPIYQLSSFAKRGENDKSSTAAPKGIATEKAHHGAVRCNASRPGSADRMGERDTA
jgi:hypothetical protein